jgi:mannose-6-phosphate isomerase-like protein (cupin superfamily)
MTPYSDMPSSRGFFREFSSEVDELELVWHRDHRDRTITVLSGEGWAIQMDDCMPVILTVGDVVQIPRATFHRVLKGRGNLQVQVVEG